MLVEARNRCVSNEMIAFADTIISCAPVIGQIYCIFKMRMVLLDVKNLELVNQRFAEAFIKYKSDVATLDKKVATITLAHSNLPSLPTVPTVEPINDSATELSEASEEQLKKLKTELTEFDKELNLIREASAVIGDESQYALDQSRRLESVGGAIGEIDSTRAKIFEKISHKPGDIICKSAVSFILTLVVLTILKIVNPIFAVLCPLSFLTVFSLGTYTIDRMVKSFKDTKEKIGTGIT